LALDLLAVAVSSALLIVSFPPFPLGGLAWMGLVPLLLALRDAGAGRAAALAYAMGLLLSVAHGIWLPSVAGISLGLWGLMHAFHATYFAGFGVLASLVRRHVPGWALVGLPTAWVLIEYLRLHSGFLSFPWPVLAYSQLQAPAVAEVASVTGMWGVSFLVVGANAALAELVLRLVRPASDPAPPRLAVAAAALSGVALLLLPHLAAGRSEEPPEAKLRVAVVQAGVWQRASSVGRERVLEEYRQRTESLRRAEPALVVWPESAIAGAIPGDFGLVSSLVAVTRQSRAFLLVGASGADKNRPGELADARRASNSAFLIAPDGSLRGRYDKVRLLPFNEYLPLREWLPWPSWLAGTRPDARPGARATTFELGSARFGVLICWENLFPDTFRRIAAQDVDFVVSMTNESFVPSPMAREQLLAFNAFRAIENHTPVVRAASTGVSGMIAADGRLVARLRDERGRDVDAHGTLVGEIQLGRERTFYSRHGDWFVTALALLAGAAVVRAATRKAPARREPRSPARA
jgi:apolipoprotein N-acyltransferase